MNSTTVALVHDYLTQRGGAERVVASLQVAFPNAPLYTSLYEPEGTFPIFQTSDVSTMGLNRLPLLRRQHRLAFPIFAPMFSRLTVDAEVTICSSSGWSHGTRTTGRKIVYCHTPARWLYQTDVYLGENGSGLPGIMKKTAARTLKPSLRRWDHKAALSADRYLVNSTVVKRRVQETYGIAAEVVHPCVSIRPEDRGTPFEGAPDEFWLCVSRLLPYKNLDAILEAFAAMPSERLLLVGSGPERDNILRQAPKNAHLAGPVDDETLIWLYANCKGLVAASYEDFGLTPLEANTFGRPVAALAWGGFLDTVVDGQTGCLFDEPTQAAIARALQQVNATTWSESDIMSHAQRFSEERFVERVRSIVDEERRAT